MNCYLNEKCKPYKNGQCPFPGFCIKKFKIDKFCDEALLSINQRKNIELFLDASNNDYEAFVKLNNIKNNILNFVESGKNLYIFSTKTGNGKTSWSIKLLQAYISKIWYNHEIKCVGLFISVPRYLLSIKDAISNNNEYANHIKQNVLEADLVIWDDIATKNMTEFETENVLSIIDARINLGKSNIFTSNITNIELPLYVGDRLSSRILGTSEPIKFIGEDKRILSRGVENDSTSNP